MMPQPPTRQRSLPGLWQILKYFWPHVRPYGTLIVVSLLALFAEVGLRLLEPWPLKFVFDRIIGHRPGKFLTQLDLPSGNLLALAAISIVAITGLRALASYWQTIGFAQLGNRALSKVRNQLY